MHQDLEAAVIAACTEHHEQNWRNYDYRACIYIGTEFFVKYGSRTDLEHELATQEYIFAYSQEFQTPDTPRIAKVLHHFVNKITMYLVMEYIHLQEYPPKLDERIQNTILWLSQVPLPVGHPLGPVGGAPIRHRLFKDYEAPFILRNTVELDRYIKKAYGFLPFQGRKHVVPSSVSGERLMFTQSDMDDSNFGVDETGRTVLMDFNEIGILPETFVAFTLCADKKFDPIAASLGLSDNSNMYWMASIAHVLVMIADPRLGLKTESRKGPRA